MKNLLPNDWIEVLNKEFEKSYWIKLVENVTTAYNTSVCYPPKNSIFNAFKHCAFKDVKVVIIGQDPYHGKGQANGMCFSYLGNQKFPPSLKNIYKEITSDLGVNMPMNYGDLTFWAKQGVLLLNVTLTVEQAKPNSHKKYGWELFTNAVIETISESKKDIVFLLWGGFAQKKESLINTKIHCVLKATHPSPLGANKGGWFGCQHFSKTNFYLNKVGVKSINWELKWKNQPPTLFTL